MARAFLLGIESLAAGDSCYAQMRLETPIIAALGDRFVIRTYSPMRTVGGGIVLDPVATKHRRRDQGLVERLSLLKSGDSMRIVEAYIRAAPSGARLESLRARINSGPGSLKNIVQGLMEQERVLETSAGIYIHRDTLRELEDRIELILKTYQAKNRLTWGMPKEELRERLGSLEMAFLSWVLGRMEKDERIFSKKASVRAGTGEVQLSPVEKQARSLILALLDAKPFQPPSEREIEGKVKVSAEVFRKVLSLLIQDGEVIRLEPGLVMLAGAVESAKAKIRGYLSEHGAGTASDLKTALGTTRKYAVPLLEHLDRLGITRRVGDKRTLPGSDLKS
jgi:selenocysteine-specific elongation factor